MEANQEVAVTLSPELFERLRAEARRLGVPLRYVVASLVLDTMETAVKETPEGLRVAS